MRGLGFPESDWRRFRDKIWRWQEDYIAQLNREYVAILSRPGSAAENFWEVEERMRKDRKKTAVECVMARSNMIDILVALLAEGAITMNDLSEFSEGVQQRVQGIYNAYYGSH